MSLSAEVVALTRPPRRTHEPHPRPGGERPPRPAGIRAEEGLAEAEALMAELAGAGGGDVAGTMVAEHLDGGGKRLRARLALSALEALGGRRSAGVAWAAACELLHNATLVHDDLQDGDHTRRGRPTTWVRWGAAQAVNAGDLLLMLPFLALEHLPAPPEHRWALASAVARHAAETVRGQAAELALSAAGGAGWDDYRRAVQGKTGALFQLPVEGAALLAGRAPAQAHALAAAFRGIGVLFQLQDDVLDLYGDKGRGRAGDDLREGKTSALVVEHLALHPSDAAWLHPLLALPRDATPEDGVERAMERFREGGALHAVLHRIEAEARDVAGCVALAHEPALREIAEELMQVALAPIAHVRAPRRALVAVVTAGEGA